MAAVESRDDEIRHAELIALNRQIRACRLCHAEGYLDERGVCCRWRVDPEADAPLPRILLVGQAPGLRATNENRPFAGAAGDKLRAWMEMGGVRRRISGARYTSVR